MNKIKIESRKKLNLKHAKYVHILKDRIILYCEKTCKKGIKTEWQETCPNDIPLRLQSGKKYNASYIYLAENLVGIIKEIEALEWWPENQSYTAEHKLSSLIIRTKKINLSLNNYMIDGKNYSHCDFSIIRCSENSLFS